MKSYSKQLNLELDYHFSKEGGGQALVDKAFDLLFDEVFRQSTEAVLTTMDN